MGHCNILLLALSIFVSIEDTGAADCEIGWTAYKDELCIQVFPNFLTYTEAKEFCSEQGTELSKSSLVMVKEEDMQELLVNSTNDIFDNMWLGGRYDEEAAQFLWDDGEPLTYTNWGEGSPRNDSDVNICIELRPINAKSSTNPQGKWADVNCNKRNLVICQRVLTWTLQDAIGEIVKMRKQLESTQNDLQVTQSILQSTQNDLQATTSDLQETRNDLQTVNARVIPVGSIYVEHHGQPSPSTLWPELTWQDISSTYAGLFFRVLGGSAAGWGATQSECAPRISQASFNSFSSPSVTLSIPATGWSAYGWVGYRCDPCSFTEYKEGFRFFTKGCEVRPTNQAVRIWKRTA